MGLPYSHYLSSSVKKIGKLSKVFGNTSKYLSKTETFSLFSVVRSDKIYAAKVEWLESLRLVRRFYSTRGATKVDFRTISVTIIKLRGT